MPDSTKTVRYGRDQFEQYEAEADGAIDVGDLVEQTATGIQSHATDGGHVDRILVAKDDRDRGMELGDSYPSGDNAKFLACNAGAGVHMRLDAGETATGPDDGAATRLVSSGNGALRAYDGAGGDADTDVVAVAAESLDNSGGADPVDIAVEVTR